jgi:hypothetical protein
LPKSSGRNATFIIIVKAIMARIEIEKGILDQKYNNPTFKGFFRQ